MKLHRVFLCLLLLTAGTSVAQKVTTDFDHSADFYRYRTYTWVKGTPVNQLWDQRIIDGIDRRLELKGFKKVDMSENPDLVILYHGAVGQQAQINVTDYGGWGWRWGGGPTTTTIDQIPVGQLSVDVGDPKTKKLLWIGSAADTLSDNPEKNQKKLDKALDKMFKNFPPYTHQ